MKILSLLKSIVLVFVVFVCVSGCNHSDKLEAQIAAIPMDIDVVRFDREFATAGEAGFPSLKKTYPYLFPAADSVWISKMKDSLQIELLQEVHNVFGSFKEEQEDLNDLYKHIVYYFPESTVPKVITLTNDVRYRDRVVLADTLLLISLDNYLGTEHKYYSGFQRYIAESLDKKYLVSDVASAFAKKIVPKPRDRTFLAKMVYYGKELYIKDKLLPFAEDSIKIGYTKEEMNWAKTEEEPIWRNFIENQYIYSTDARLNKRFLDPAPFSKFGLELDNESPGRLGRYIGWQIVRSFMENNTVALKQLLTMPAEELFKKSNYKPRN